MASPIKIMLLREGIMDGSKNLTKVGVSCVQVTPISFIALAISFNLVFSSGMQIVPPIISGLSISVMDASKECAAN
jgi:hypothetical protein